MLHLRTHGDRLRLLMLREPRGYPAANCNVILPPTHPDAQAGFVIMEQVEYPAMSGTNTICVVTALLETGMIEAREPVTELTLEAPAGLIRVRADVIDGKVTGVTFLNVPAFAVHLDREIDVPHLGRVTVDVAWGGMFYVIADADALGVSLDPGNGRKIARIGEMVKKSAQEQLLAEHPLNPGFNGITISQLSAKPRRAGVDQFVPQHFDSPGSDQDHVDVGGVAGPRVPPGSRSIGGDGLSQVAGLVAVDVGPQRLGHGRPSGYYAWGQGHPVGAPHRRLSPANQ